MRFLLREGLAARHIIDVVKINIRLSFRGDFRIEIANGARGGVARVLQGLRGGLIVFVEHGKADDRFSPHFQNAGIGNAQGIGFDRQYLRRHILAHHAVAPRRRADEFAVFVGEADGQTVELVFDGIRRVPARRLGNARQKRPHFLVRDRFIQAIQPRDMVVAHERLDGVASHSSRRAVGIHLSALRFHAFEFVVQGVVFLIRNGRIIQDVIFVRPAIQNVGKFSLRFHNTLNFSKYSSAPSVESPPNRTKRRGAPERPVIF